MNQGMIVVALTGASGPVMGIRLIEELLNSGEEVTAIVSETAWKIIGYELSLTKEEPSPMKRLLERRGIAKDCSLFTEFQNNDLSSPIASGSSPFEAVVVIPTSMKTLSAVACGYADTLIARACDVALKERRRCIMVPRETPLNLIHMENLLRVARAGGEIVPPVPGFYTHPQSIDDIINFIVGKILNLLGRKHTLFQSWGGV